MLIATVALALQVATPGPPVDRSAAKWGVDYNPDRCMISRPFGDGAEASILAIDAHPLTGRGGIVLMLPRVERRGSQGIADVALSDGTTMRASWIAMAGTAGMAAFKLGLDEPEWQTLLTADSMTVTGLSKRPVVVPIKGLAKAVDAAKVCGRALLKSWGADPDAMIDATSGRWVSYTDYPQSALIANQQGIVKMLLTVNDKGRPTDCKVVVSSHVAALDAVSCRILIQRARFAPSPMTTRFTYTMTSWAIPN